MAEEPLRTVTYPRDRRGYQSGPDLITALGIGGKGIALPMLATQDSFMLGRAETCDLRADNKYLSSMQARIERIVNSCASIRIINVSNGKNDIVYNGEIAAPEFIMGAGEWFVIGDTRYYALNEEMRLARPTVMEVLGVRQHDAIDNLLITAVRDSARHVLLSGEPGCDQVRLGRVIHQISHRRHNGFHALTARPKLNGTTRQDIRDASSGTVLVQLYHRGKLNERVVAALIAPEADLRLIICAHSRDKAEASFPTGIVNNATEIAIAPLRKRASSEIQELLDQWLIARRSHVRFASLRPEVRASLLSHTWPENLQELREAADNLAQLAHYRSGRQAAKETRITRGTLRGWLKSLNLRKLSFPIVSDKDEDDPDE